ncbi:uncharacterized protein [Haliotis cracherodii]|uniref:uncharacterized protein LOC124132559 n=1 Tax=Haliotis rufescens TaxID=6454 RepID=UPI001EB0243D|nr:uncharacterized protein LOC124132559 [Haliotis rufescens]
MAGRPASVGPDSSSGSTINLPSLNVSKLTPHPEEWTLPHEWNIEKREVFQNWKMDVQNQIANIATSLDKSLQHFPHPEVGPGLDYQDEIEKAQMEKVKQERERQAGNTLLYGLARTACAERR